jgi:hypothetical protein
MNVIRSLLPFLILVALTLTLLLAGAAGVGVLLHRLIPAIGLGNGVLIGTLALSVSVHFVLRMFDAAHSVREELDEVELEAAELKEFVTAMHRPARGRRTRR